MSEEARTGQTPKNLLTHSDATKARALRAYRKTHTVTAACRAAQVGRSTWYQWRQDDPAFDRLVQDAEQAVLDKLEATAIKRATADEGPSDTLLIFLLKSLRHEKYGDRKTMTLISPDIQARLEKQIAIIASRETWLATELLDALDGVWA